MRLLVTIVLIAVLGAGGYFAWKHFNAPKPATVSNATGEIADQIRFFETLKKAAPAGALASEDEYQAFADAISEFAALEIGVIADEGVGAIARNVVVTAKNDPDMGARIEELRLYGADAAAIAAIGEGREGRVAERIDARGIEWFGLDKFTQEIMDEYVETVEKAVEGIGEEKATAAFDPDYKFERYDLSVGRMLIDGLVLFPLERAPGEDAAQPGLFDIIQAMAAWSRAYSVDAYGVYDFSATAEFEQMGQPADMSFSIPVMGARDYRRGDMGAMVAENVSYEMNMQVPTAEPSEDGTIAPDAPSMLMTMEGEMDRYAVSGVKLAKAYDYLVQGKMPPTSETGLLSLGVWRVEGEHIKIGGEPLYSVGVARADLSHFHWLAPTSIKAESRDIVYNVGGFMRYMSDAMAASGEAMDEEALKVMDDSLAILNKHGLDAVRFDMNMAYDWDPQSGAGETSFLFDMKDFMTLNYAVKAAAPTFDALAAFEPATGDEVDWAGLVELVRNELALKRLDVSLKDDGGLEKAYKLAVDFAQLTPENPQDAANNILRNADPADLRISNAAMVRMMAPQMAQNFPPASDYLVAVADFIQKGGTLRMVMEPSAPVALDMFKEKEAELQANPALASEMLGLAVTHETAPAE